MDSENNIVLLYDYYGSLLTGRQQECIELRYCQDLSLAEIGQELQISRQSVYDTITRAENLLRKMESRTGCVGRDQACRKAARAISENTKELMLHPDPKVRDLARKIASAAYGLEE